MKKIIIILALVTYWSCDNSDTKYEMVTVATPQVMSKSDFRASLEVLPPQPIDESGKMYAYANYIFVNDQYRGIHVIDNSNPVTPTAIAFLKIAGNVDIAIKNNYLYADSATDLVVFDISNIQSIEPIERLEDVFSVYDYQIPEAAQEVNWSSIDLENQVIVGWTLTQERREVSDDQFDFALENGTGGNDVALNDQVGTGGSLARFKIVGNYLYTVGVEHLDVFNISNLSQPILANSKYLGWNIETIFHADGYLYIGSTTGMFIYGLENPSNPNYISEFMHWEMCDPVVVDGDYAFLTLRGGNLCGQMESVLEVIDISNKNNPQLVATYAMDNPYGLGFKDNQLFVCDGNSGLKVYDKTNPLDLQMQAEYNTMLSKDVIPLETVLLMIGDGVLYQYEYTPEGLNPISTMQL